MRIELPPSSIPVGDEVAIDAGSLGMLADLGRQRRVRHVFLTHGHRDHVATLPMFLENVYEPGPGRGGPGDPLRARGVAVRHPQRPHLARLLRALPARRRVRDRDRARAAAVRGAGRAHAHTRAGRARRRDGRLRGRGRPYGGGLSLGHGADHRPVEPSRRSAAPAGGAPGGEFPGALAGLAAKVGHHRPASFALETRKLPRDVRWVVVHRKPPFAAEIARELSALGLPNVELVQPGRAYEW